MRSKLKWLSAGMFIGATLGGILLLFLFKSPPETLRQAQGDNSKEILGFIIDEWTNPGSDSIHVATLGNKTHGMFEMGKIPDTIRALAARGEALYKIPRGVTCAQWILESKWGLCNLGAENYFGLTLAAVKQYMDRPHYVIQTDMRFRRGIAIRERVRFARFNNIAECFSVYGQYIKGSQLYKIAFKYSNQPERFARILAKHYAADPDYAMKLITLMRIYKLE